jgi:S1-C subfamily serine protease
MQYPDGNRINNPGNSPYQRQPGPASPWDQTVSQFPQGQIYQEDPPLNWNQPPRTPPLPPARGGGMRTGAILLLAVVLLVVFGTGGFAGWVFAHSTQSQQQGPLSLPGQGNSQVTVPALTNNNVQEVRATVIAKVKPSVVQINVVTNEGQAIGSGVIVQKDGYIVTNNHVISGAQSIEVVLADGTKVKAQLTGTDVADDLAVIKITPTANMVTASLGDSSKLVVGQEVLAIGNPLGITQTVTNGIISALNRTVSESNKTTILNAIQTDAPINPGNSGGALVDMQGNVIGIPTLTAVDPEFNAPANGVGFAIPSNRVSQIVPQIIQNGQVTHTGRPVLGIKGVDVDQAMQQMDNLAVDHGVLISDVTAGGPAEKAGLQQGDVIIGFDDKNIDNMSGLQDALGAKVPGDKVAVRVSRGNQQLTVNVTLGEAAANG